MILLCQKEGHFDPAKHTIIYFETVIKINITIPYIKHF